MSLLLCVVDGCAKEAIGVAGGLSRCGAHLDAWRRDERARGKAILDGIAAQQASMAAGAEEWKAMRAFQEASDALYADALARENRRWWWWG